MNVATNMKKESLIVRIINKLKRWYWRWRNSDPIKNCPVYKNKGCSHVDGLLCNFPNCSTYHEYIEQMLSDDWEGDEEIFVPEDECSKPFNTPKILGCIDNLNEIE